MILFCFVHFIIITLTLLDLLGRMSKTLDTNICYTFHTINHAVYIIFNCVVFFFFFDCARNARIHSSDIMIFDAKKRIWKYAILIPLILLIGHFVANASCAVFKFPTLHTIVYTTHIGIEFVVVYFYFTWYKNQLQKFVGGVDINEKNDQKPNDTFDYGEG